MDDDTVSVVASNLTIAYFSRYQREPKPPTPTNIPMREIEAKEDSERFRVLFVYEKFKSDLLRAASNSDEGTK